MEHEVVLTRDVDNTWEKKREVERPSLPAVLSSIIPLSGLVRYNLVEPDSIDSFHSAPLPLSLHLSLSLSLSLDPLENFFHEISSKKWIRCQRRVARILVIPMSSRVHFAVELSQAIRPSREMARSSVECILIMVNSCNAQPCRRECELFASGSEMYPVQKYHFHRANSFPPRDRNHATREQFLEITILQITTLSTCISPIWKCITNDNTTRILFHTPPRNFFNAR